MRRLLSVLRRAIEDYEMIEEGDKIAVGLSGGKDSLALLYAMSELRKFYPLNFELYAITLDLGYPEFDATPLREFCEKIDVPFTLVKTQIAEIVFDIRKEENPCSLCAKLRRGALNNAAKDLGCSKILLGHHFDDVVETFMLSLMYEGRLSCFSPVTYLDRIGVTIMRPLVYTPEYEIKSFAKKYNLPICKNPCKADGATKREEIKHLLENMRAENKDIKEKIFSAICKAGIGGFIVPQIGARRPLVRRKPEDEQ